MKRIVIALLLLITVLSASAEPGINRRQMLGELRSVPGVERVFIGPLMLNTINLQNHLGDLARNIKSISAIEIVNTSNAKAAQETTKFFNNVADAFGLTPLMENTDTDNDGNVSENIIYIHYSDENAGIADQLVIWTNSGREVSMVNITGEFDFSKELKQ